ncbi:MAG: hypothetical protein JNJ77_11475 [Planctomycetia bacterium]|nr:hypothetical protein [Planctomycetia bacterium]
MQRALKFPGYLGVHMLRPMPGSREYGAVIKFNSRDDWHAFRDSAEYRGFVESLRPMLETEPKIETICGLESWFTPLGQQFTRVPPRWKMAVVTWVGVSLTVYIVSWLLSPMTNHWPTLLAYMFANAVVVAGLTWIVMPLLNRVFRPWLLPAHRPVSGVH